MATHSPAQSMIEFDIKMQCHVNTNEEGDRFVGVKADSNRAIVCFPIGYQLPETDMEIRTEIKCLIHVLSEFTNKQDRLLAINKIFAHQTVEFPISAYMKVIEYYFSIGGKYYVEKDFTYKTASTGTQDWSKTVRKQMPLVQRNGNVNSFIYTSFTVRSVTPNDTKLITQINRFCVFHAFARLGWLYVPYMPEEPGPCPDIKTSISIVQGKIAGTNDDRKRTLFQGMKNMLEYMDKETPDNQFYFGTDNFDYVWEKLIDRIFGERNKEEFFPRSRWLLDYGKDREGRPLMPDTIMLYNNKYYVIDAKCYKYGWTGIPYHLPDGSSINKQITYGEYLEKYKGINPDSLFNAFIMPYNMMNNCFNMTTVVGNVGEAVGDWRQNKKYYERIQGIVMDTRHIMHHYVGNAAKEKGSLAVCIESVTKRDKVSRRGAVAVASPMIYEIGVKSGSMKEIGNLETDDE